jgi:hypothetical protein
MIHQKASWYEVDADQRQCAELLAVGGVEVGHGCALDDTDFI